MSAPYALATPAPVLYLACLLLGGCASPSRDVVVRTQTELDASGSTLQVSGGGSSFAFYVSSIEGPKGKQDFALSPVEGFYRLEPGATTITVMPLGYDYTSPTIDPETLGARLHFIALPGVPYTLTGVDDGTDLKLAITERNTLRAVTGEVSMPVSRPKIAPSPKPGVDVIVIPGATPLLIPIPRR